MHKTPPQKQKQPLLTKLVERIADHKGVNPDDPDFCLYDATDPEALDLLLEETTGPLTTNFHVDDACVTVEKAADGKITVEVESVKTLQHACD